MNAITARINNSVAFRKKRGDYFGIAPYGYKTFRDDNGKRVLVESENEKKLIGLIYKRNKEGCKIENIVNELNSCNFLKRGKEWKNSSVKNIIKNNNIFKSFSKVQLKRKRIEVKSYYNLRSYKRL